MPPVCSTTANNDETASSFDSDHDGIFPYYDPFLLQENEVKSSQDLTAFFSPLEAKKVALVEEEENDEASVEFLGESGNSLVDYPHRRFNCIEFAIGKDPMKYCGNCFCVICDARAADGCTDWNAHCRLQQN